MYKEWMKNLKFDLERDLKIEKRMRVARPTNGLSRNAALRLGRRMNRDTRFPN